MTELNRSHYVNVMCLAKRPELKSEQRGVLMDARQIQPRMYVIGSDGECVGTVASVEDHEIRLAEAQSVEMDTT